MPERLPCLGSASRDGGQLPDVWFPELRPRDAGESETERKVVEGVFVRHRKDDEVTVVPVPGVLMGVLEGCVSCLDCLLPGCQISPYDDVQARDLWFSHFLDLDFRVRYG